MFELRFSWILYRGRPFAPDWLVAGVFLLLLGSAAPVVAATISGGVFHDVNGDANPSDAVRTPGVAVSLYQDGGDGIANGVDDSLIDSDTTGLAGDFSLTATIDGDYWVVVDSKGMSASGDIWAEQTYGTAGALVDDGAGGTTELVVAGAAYGGRSTATSDDATSLATAEHVLRVVLAGADVSGIDVGFSIVVVTNTNDGDDDLIENRTVQGSVRQFIQNSNAVDTVSNSVFRIPTHDSNYNGAGQGEYRVAVQSGLPSLSKLVNLDATTQPGYSGTPIIWLDGSGAGASIDGINCSDGSDNSVIRGLAIHQFSDDGIELSSGADGITIAGNWIGTDNSGSATPGNADDGIDGQAANTTIGGTGPNDRNVINNSGDEGITFASASATGVVILGNYIGLEPDGTSGSGNGDVGIALLTGASGATIGGPSAAERNVISMNFEGIEMRTADNIVQGNYIGTDANGTLDRGNRSDDGIELLAGTSNNLIGGAGAGEGNLIAFNQRAGVNIAGGVSNAVLGNRIHSNNLLGIDLGNNGVTGNDLGDGDSGANGLQNFPVLTSALTNGVNSILIGGSINSNASTNFRIEFFASLVADGSGNGEGERYLGSTTVMTNVSGDAAFMAPLTATVALGEFVTATATVDLGGGTYGATSEFGPNVTASSSIVSLAGRIFEDVNYGGGTGRGYAVASAQAGPFAIERGGAVVELYDALGDFVSTTLSAPNGTYNFPGLIAGLYTVRVVNSTVTSTRPGSDATEQSVQTYRIDGDGEPAGTGSSRVGGEMASNEDAAANSGAQNLAILQGADADLDGITEWTQSIVTVDARGGDVSGIDFGFNFDTVVNTNDRDQGSLRQFLLNSNLLDNTNLDQEDAPAGIGAVTKVPGDEHSIFMIPVSDPGYLPTIDGGIGNAFIIRPATQLPIVTSSNTVIDGRTQTAFTGDSNLAVIETSSGPVGTPTTGPEVIVDYQDQPINSPGLLIQAANTTIESLGMTAMGGSVNQASGFRFAAGSAGSVIRNCTSWGNDSYGFRVTNTDNVTVDGNVGRGNGGPSHGTADGLIIDNATNATVTGNTFVGNIGHGIDASQTSGNLIQLNLLKGNGATVKGSSGTQGSGMHAHGAGTNSITISGNEIVGNRLPGVLVEDASTNSITISANRIFGNGALGIDLVGGVEDGFGVTSNDANDADAGANNLLNYPVITNATESGGTVTVDFDADLPVGDYRVEFYRSVAGGDPSGYGEGEFLGGAVDINHAGLGPQSFSHSFGGAAGDVIAATVTECSDGTCSSLLGTSEFSATSIAVAGVVDVSVTKVVDDPTPDEGGAITYTVTVTNNGPANATGIQITDVLPAGINYLNDVASLGSYNSGTGIWTLGALNNGATETLSITTLVGAGTSGSIITNSAALTAVNQPDTNSGNDADSVDIDVVDDVGLSLAKLVDDNNPGENQTVTYTITVSNNGPAQATGIEVTDFLPAGVTYVSDTPVQGSYDNGTGIWTVGTLNNGFNVSLDIVVTVDPGTAGQMISNTGTITALDQPDANPLNDTDTVDFVVRDDADLSVTKIVNNGIPDEGQTVTYTVTVTNNGPTDATNVEVTDALPAGVTYVSDTPSLGSYSNGTGAWTVGAVNSGASETLIIAASVDVGTAGNTIVNTASVTAVDQPDNDNSNDSDSADILVADGVDLALTKIVDNPTPGEGQSVTYTVNLSNSGPSDATGVEVTDLLPPGVTFVSANATQGGYDNGTGVWAVGAVNAAAVATLDLAVTIDNGTGGSRITNTASVTAVDQPDPNAVNDTANANIDVPVAVSGTIVVDLVPQASMALNPGEAPREVWRVRMFNDSLANETVTQLHLGNAIAAAATQAQLDAEWQPLQLVYDDGSAGTPLGSDTLAGGRASFIGLNVTIPAGITVELYVRSAPSLSARDGEQLALSLAQSDLVFVQTPTTSATWPLVTQAQLSVDGMVADQIIVNAIAGGNVAAGTQRVLALDVTLPPNGYLTDTLNRFNVTNLGNAQDIDDIEVVEAWADNGDGVFSSVTDTPLGILAHTGNRWEVTGLSTPVPLTGQRVFVTVSLSFDAFEGRVVQLAIPDQTNVGVGMASDNDGPIDRVVSQPQALVIGTGQRITWTARALPSGDVTPGQEGIVLLQLDASNSYPIDQQLVSLDVTNLGVSTNGGTQADLDSSFKQLILRHDADGDGQLGNLTTDPVVGAASFSTGRARFDGINMVLPAGTAASMFVTADVSLLSAADGDELGIAVVSPLDVGFADAATLTAAWPLDSGARVVVDGLVAAQIVNSAVPAAALPANGGPALAFDLILPSNGYAPDVLNGLEILNLGTAGASDIGLNLWRDGGDGVFNAGIGDDVSLGPLSGAGNRWTSVVLGQPVPTTGLHLFVSATVGPTPTDQSTVQLAVPIGGITMASNNDGPIDATVVSPGSILISTAPLLATLEISPMQATEGQIVAVSMRVTNSGSEDLQGIVPSPLTLQGSGSVVLQSGPQPASFDLSPGGNDVFTWTYQASAPGEVEFTGNATGLGVTTSTLWNSAVVVSDPMRIYRAVAGIEVFPVANMPFTLNQGETDVVPLILTLRHPGGVDDSGALLRGLRVRLEDEVGGPIIPADLLSRVVINEGTNRYVVKTALETSGDEVDLQFSQPVRVTPFEPVTIGLRLDVSPTTTVPAFRLAIDASSSFDTVDEISGGAVATNVGNGSYPILSGIGRLVAPAAALAVNENSLPAIQVGPGQTGVELLSVQLDTQGVAGLSSDVLVGSLAISMTDTNGAGSLNPEVLLSRIRVVAAGNLVFDDVVIAQPDNSMRIQLNSSLAASVGKPVDILVSGDVLSSAVPQGFRVELSDPSSIEVVDANTLVRPPVIYSAIPIVGGSVTVQSQATTLLASSSARFPAVVAIGSRGVAAMDVTLTHPGAPQTAAIRVESLTILCRDEDRNSVIPSALIDRVQVLQGGSLIADMGAIPASGDAIAVPVSGLMLNAGQSIDLTLEVDIEASAPNAWLELLIEGPGLFAVDANLDVLVTVNPDVGATLPISSGLTELYPPSDELEVVLESHMPAVLAVGTPGLWVGTLRLTNTAFGGIEAIDVDRLIFRSADREFVPLGLGEVASSMSVLLDGEPWAFVGGLSKADSMTLVSGQVISLDPGESAELEIRVDLQSATVAGSFRMGVDQADVGVVAGTGSALLGVRVTPEPGEVFPLWTEAGGFSAAQLEDSYANFPNPFAAGRETTTIVYSLASPASITLRVLSSRGEPVITLRSDEPRGAGLYQDDIWNGRNARGTTVVNGVYLAELKVTYDDGTSERLLRKIAVVR